VTTDDGSANKSHLFRVVLTSRGIRHEREIPQGPIGQHVLTGSVPQLSGLGEALAQDIANLSPLSMSRLSAVLSEDGLEHRDRCRLLLGRNMGQRVPHAVHPTALMGRTEHLLGGRSQALVVVRDDELDPTKSSVS